MILIDAFKHLPRANRYQFKPSKYDPSISSPEGIAQVGSEKANFGLPANAVNAFTISPSLSGTLTCFFSESADLKAGWLFKMYSNSFSPTGPYMACRVDSIVPYYGGGQQVNFTSYASDGEGNYDSWFITSDFLGSENYIQNSYPSAVACKDRAFFPVGQFSFPVDVDSTLIVTSDTPTSKSGYTFSTYKGLTVTKEDEYDYNRPYEGITITLTRPREQTTVTTTYTYDPDESNTTVNVVEIDPITHSHTFDFNDFFPITSGERTYYPGAQIPNPTPSYCTNKFSLGVFTGGYYTKTYQAYYPDPPPAGPRYRIVFEQYESWAFIAGDGVVSMSPGTFFP